MAERPKVRRCAIYTRKSTEEGLDQAYNSLDAQRDACTAYIASQKHEGWVLVDNHYDDGGFSGGSLDRPALQTLFADLAEGAVAFQEGAPAEKLAGGKFFVDRYAKEKYREPFEAYGAFAFAGMNLVLDVIEKVGPDRKKVRDELRRTKNYDSIIGKVTLDDHGQNTVDLITKYVVQDGDVMHFRFAN